MPYYADGYQITRHVCPRNCYDACGMLAYVKNGRLEKVAGDPAHGYTKGKLCAKGYSYLKRVYHPERLKYPLRQIGGRGSGRWERITWDEALETICETIFTIIDRYQSTLPLCLNKYSGNFGLLHCAIEGWFSSLGPTTQAVGSPCWSAGLDAQYLDMGNNCVSAPQEIEKAHLVLLWGVNPAWTAIHSMPYIYRARERGAKIVVIDPLYTQTARKADIYVQIKAGEDGALALALAALITKAGKQDEAFLRQHATGWDEFRDYLLSLDVDELAVGCGQSMEAIEGLAKLFVENSPVYIWAGFGLQRHCNGGQNLRAIDALAALTGNIGRSGSGVQYAHLETWNFTGAIMRCRMDNRTISINSFADQLQSIGQPPVRFLWFSCRNAVTQDARTTFLLQQLKQLEFIVTVDQFLTPTAQHSDIVLPCTTQFEELDIVPSYWHHWLAVNEQAISPFYESRSELTISQELAKKMNLCRQGSCSFAVNKTAAEFLEDEFTDDLYQRFGIDHWSQLINGPRQAQLSACAWNGRSFETPSGKFEFVSSVARENGLSPMAVYHLAPPPSEQYPLRLISPHFQHGLNSQFLNVDWLGRSSGERVVYLHPITATRKKISSGQMTRLVNGYGKVVVRAELNPEIPMDTVVAYQDWVPKNGEYINTLVGGLPTDMGKLRTGATGLAFYDVFLDIEPI